MKKLIIFLVSIVIFTSCKKALEEVPKSFISKANFYETESDAQAAIRGAYSSFGTDYYGITYYLFVVLHSDYADGRGSQAPISLFDRNLDQTNIDRASVNWAVHYQQINQANSVLNNVPNVPKITDAVKNRILAEAHFLRAMAYFNLVRGYGAVPIKTMESADISAIAGVREPVAKVYDLILADALAAEKDLPESVADQTGRASKYAAKMLLAQIYLTQEKWTEAAAKASEVIAAARFSLVPVKKQEDFYKIFATVTNTEDIMSVHHSDTRQSQIPTYEHRPNTPPYNYSSGGNFAWLPNLKSFIGTSWNDKDLRKSFNLYTKYVNANGDSIALPAASPILFKKFITTPQGFGSYSVPIYRYTEAFLIYAEAADMAAGAPSALALERLNMIKRRAYGYDPAVVSPVDYPAGLSKDGFRDAVLNERGYEFILEGRRWWDLKRTGRVKTAMVAAGRTFIDSRLLWPIPTEELNNNPALTQADQNPGY
ncbi:MAG: RagB/SusD family nutrient uptake outer membrane protein [Chitinophagaceae bacterium]